MPDTKEATNAQEVIEGEVVDILDLQRQLEDTETELMANEQFRAFIELQKKVNEQAATVWKNVEAQMIEHGIKSIKGDWGSLTIAERLNWKIDIDLLPSKFIKKVPDTTKISASYRLEDKAPKGAEPYTTQYLTKRFK